MAYPKKDWVVFANDFVNNGLGLDRSQTTTQIEHYDNLAALVKLITCFHEFSEFESTIFFLPQIINPFMTSKRSKPQIHRFLQNVFWSLWIEKARGKIFFKVIHKKWYAIKKGFLKGSLAFLQHFWNGWFRFLMSWTG